MRMFGLVGLVLASLIVGVLIKKQTSELATPAALAAPPSASTSTPTARALGQQVQEAFKQSLDAAVQQQRAMPDEAQ
ncbi:hypothetical protein [Variovorax guangxiensis]|uniref:Uncharacterized protein n=1 Tax=Variovorax guangxiensis TaxID=1775474 RepID=A0A502DYI1_9BURK|nr:hypothetical protein [Variovorax guangxiensis]RZI66335.1 MAG: hypothetical protein EOP79_08070 [Variovorax sp.]TPG26838.1 hypothetical protein EAH83_03560 [Variovorax ginsengisoli]TPG30565.1 hypothetical protein EAH82_03560 [Variovorax guangxiensis]